MIMIVNQSLEQGESILEIDNYRKVTLQSNNYRKYTRYRIAMMEVPL
jgi:hypothetical protein